MDRITPSRTELDPILRARLAALFEEGREIWARFEAEVRRKQWHPFKHGDYELVLRALLDERAGGRRFLEWGSATGVVTIVADLLGYEAHGIELDPDLVRTSRELAARHGSGARFTLGSFIPSGYRWRPAGDSRLGTIGEGRSAYPDLGHRLDHFDLVYAYPWPGEEALMLDLMRSRGHPGAKLLLYRGETDVLAYPGGREPAA